MLLATIKWPFTKKICHRSTFATSAFLVLLTLSRTSCPSLSPVRTNSCALPSGSNTVNFIFPAINGRNTRAMKRPLDLQRVHFPNAVWPVFPALEEKIFFLVHNKNMFIAVYAGSANQRAQNWKAGYQAAKLARPDISLDVTLSQTGNEFQRLCNTITRKWNKQNKDPLDSIETTKILQLKRTWKWKKYFNKYVSFDSRLFKNKKTICKRSGQQGSL